MAQPQHRFNPLPVILIGVLCAVVGYQATGERTAAYAPPSSIATVDLNAVMNGLQQWDESVKYLEAMRTSQIAQEQAQKEVIDADIERLKAMEDGPEMRSFEETVALAQLEYEAMLAFNRDVLDSEAALRMEDFYNNVKVALRQMAEAEGYHAVYVDDSSGELRRQPPPNTSRQVSIRQQIINRRLLYVNSSIDITDELIERMNNAFNAGG